MGKKELILIIILVTGFMFYSIPTHAAFWDKLIKTQKTDVKEEAA